MALYYYSFADDDGWLGAVITEKSPLELGPAKLNPGGEIVFMPYPDEAVYPEGLIDRLLDMDDLRQLDRINGGTGRVVGSQSGMEY